jgi:HEAT repeat protein
VHLFRVIAVTLVNTSIASLLWMCSTALAVPVPSRDIAALTREADLIAVGRIVSSEDVQSASADSYRRVMVATLFVDTTVKGARLELLRIRTAVPVARSIFDGRPGIWLDTYQLYFLRRIGEDYEFVSPYHPSLRAMAGVRLTSSEPLSRVIEEVAAVMSSPQSTTQEIVEAIYDLWNIHDAGVIAPLRVAFASSDSRVKLNAAVGLLMEDDVTALPFAVDMLLNPVVSDDLSNLNVAIRDGVKHEAAIPFLRRLLGHSDLDIGRAAISALGHTRSPLAFPELVATLDDLDPSIQHAAAQSLARATDRSDLIASEDGFRANRDRYRAFWKAWLAARQR